MYSVDRSSSGRKYARSFEPCGSIHTGLCVIEAAGRPERHRHLMQRRPSRDRRAGQARPPTLPAAPPSARGATRAGRAGSSRASRRARGRRRPSPASRDRPACRPNSSDVAARAAAIASNRPTTQTCGEQDTGLAHDHPDDVAAIRAERHANADLVAAARHHVRHHAVETDRREQRREAAEEAGQRRHQPLAHAANRSPETPASGT